MPPVVTIITVSYNAETEIDKTIQSVLSQTYKDYEYIFIDGGSKDCTVTIIDSYRERFSALGISYWVTSEADRGIYDAMNKGIRQACGQWVLMLNAGDCLVDANVLADVFTHPDMDGKIIYGDTILKECFRGVTYYKYHPPRPLLTICNAMPFCHQSVFVPRELMCRYGFDTDLRIAADYNFFSQVYTAGSDFVYIPRAISIFDCSGVSSANTKKLLDEYAIIHKSLYPSVEQPPQPTANGIAALVKAVIKSMLPGLVYSPARGWYREVACCQKGTR